jgi:hypothetical protein
LAFRQIVSSLDPIVIQKGKEMIALFMESIAHGLSRLDADVATTSGNCDLLGSMPR